MGKNNDYNYKEFSFLIQSYPGNRTAFSLNIFSRNIPLSNELMVKVNRHFSGPLLQINFYTLPVSFEIDNIDKATTFCCDCLIHDINCPICKMTNVFSCEYPFGHYSKHHESWYRLFIHYYKHFSVQPVSVNLKYGKIIVPNYFTEFSFFSVVNAPGRSCSKPTNVYTNYLPVDGATNCTVVLPVNVPCPSANYKADYHCDWSSTSQTKVGHLKVCFSRYRKNSRFRFLDSSLYYLCNNDNYSFTFPAVTDIIRKMYTDTYSENPFDVLGYNEDSVYFSSFNNSLLNKVVQDLKTTSGVSPAPPLETYTIKMKIICDRIHPIRRVDTIYNGKDSWLGDIFIPGPSLIVPFNHSHAVKYNYLYSPYLDCEPFTAYKRNKVVRSIRSSVTFFGSVSNSSTCASLSETANCALHSLFNSSFSNMSFLLNSNQNKNFLLLSDALQNVKIQTSTNFSAFEKFLHKENIDLTNRFRNILNKTFDNYLFNLLEGLSKNGTMEYKCHGGYCYSKLGGWLSDIFAALIEPFFNVFLSLVVRPIFKILIESFIDIIKILSDLLIKLGDELSTVLDELTSAITVLITTLLKLFTKIYKHLETRILLSEYIILFLFLIYFVKNNSVFSIVVVIIALIIFGFERKTQPSLLLPLLD